MESKLQSDRGVQTTQSRAAERCSRQNQTEPDRTGQNHGINRNRRESISTGISLVVVCEKENRLTDRQ